MVIPFSILLLDLDKSFPEISVTSDITRVKRNLLTH